MYNSTISFEQYKKLVDKYQQTTEKLTIRTEL